MYLILHHMTHLFLKTACPTGALFLPVFPYATPWQGEQAKDQVCGAGPAFQPRGGTCAEAGEGSCTSLSSLPAVPIPLCLLMLTLA